MPSTTLTYEQQIDTELAEIYGKIQKLGGKVASYSEQMLYIAQAKFYYQGRGASARKVWDMTVAEAEAKVAEKLAAPPEDGKYRRFGSYNERQAVECIANLAQARLDRHEANLEMADKQFAYRGWTRFFVVTSSKGHIHSSMSCSTCRPTTTFGWLPSLSGRTEADCVEEFGPALCSVCYPSAPVEWTSEKLTAARAAKAAS